MIKCVVLVVVLILDGIGVGSGVIISEDGIVLIVGYVLFED